MKILFVHAPPDLYGASRSLLRLTNRLKQDGHSVKVILPLYGELVDALKSNGIEIIIQENLSNISRKRFKSFFFVIMFIFRIPFSVLRLIKIIKSFKPDILHTNTSLIVSSSIAAKICGIRHIWHVRESFTEFGFLWKYYRQFIQNFSSNIICVSTPISQQFKKRLIGNKVITIYNGIPKEEFISIEEKRITTFKSQFGLNGHIIVGVVGRIKFGRKGQDVFLKAAALLKDSFPNVRYLIIGSTFPGNEKHLELLYDLIEELDLGKFVILTGDVEDIQIAYSSLDVSVLPSNFPEPFSGVVIESMAMAKPVVGTRIGGTVEQIEDGVTGFLVEPNDPESMAAALEKLLCNPELRDSMSNAGRHSFEKQFEFGHFYKTVLDLYKTPGSMISRK